MGKLFGAGSLFSTLGSVGGAVNAAVLAITILCIILLVKITNLLKHQVHLEKTQILQRLLIHIWLDVQHLVKMVKAHGSTV